MSYFSKKIICTILCSVIIIFSANAYLDIKAEENCMVDDGVVGVKLYAPQGEGSYVQFDQSSVKGKKYVQGTDITLQVNVYSSGLDDGSYDYWTMNVKNVKWGYYIEWSTERYKFKSVKGEDTVTVTIPTADFEPGTYKLRIETNTDVMKNDYSEWYEFEIIEPVIKGKCQMPYTGKGGGYLIGIETYEDNDYLYEMLILDCTLLRDGKDAWVYTTGKCKVPENCLWTIWQPQYGYYWTLFRVYDTSGTLLEEQCYGFVNAY